MAESRVSPRRQVAVKEIAAQEVKAFTGNRAAAYAAKLIHLGVGMFYPIGPSDEVMESFRELITHGEATNARVLQMENERGLIAAQTAIASQGIRTMFATSGVGLIWGFAQMKYADRVPMMVVVASRSISGTVNSDHQDYFMMRDLGWLMFYCENAQDVLDTVIQAFKVAEDQRVRLPVFVGYDGWEVSHSTYRCSVPSQEDVDAFLPLPTVSPEEDILTEDWYEVTKDRRMRVRDANYQENRYKHRAALQRAKTVIDEVGHDFQDRFGRDFVGSIETYQSEDAEVILVTMGSMVTTARFVVDAMREAGERVGVIKLRTFRPFPEEALAKAMGGAKVVAILERNPLEAVYSETRAALCDSDTRPLVMGRVVGLGGRDVSYDDIIAVVREALEAARTGKVANKMDYQLRGRSE